MLFILIDLGLSAEDALDRVWALRDVYYACM